mgnify:CR=1 FL=1
MCNCFLHGVLAAVMTVVATSCEPTQQSLPTIPSSPSADSQAMVTQNQDDSLSLQIKGVPSGVTRHLMEATLDAGGVSFAIRRNDGETMSVSFIDRRGELPSLNFTGNVDEFSDFGFDRVVALLLLLVALDAEPIMRDGSIDLPGLNMQSLPAFGDVTLGESSFEISFRASIAATGVLIKIFDGFSDFFDDELHRPWVLHFSE